MKNINNENYLKKGIEFGETQASYLNEYDNFIGRVCTPEEIKPERFGQVRFNKYGTIMTIIDYKSNKDVTVFFETENYGRPLYYIRYGCRYDSFDKGTLLSPYDPTVKNTGHLGEGIYTPSEYPREYNVFTQMMRRCDDCINGAYSDPSFEDFQNFCTWSRLSYYEFPGERMELIPNIDPKIHLYHPYTSIYVPEVIRRFMDTFLDYFIYNTKDMKVRCKVNGEELYFGNIHNVDEAFKLWKNAKKEEMLRIADYYMYEKGGQYIPQFRMIYDAMINFEIPERRFY